MVTVKLKPKKKFCRLILEGIILNLEGISPCGICFLIFFFVVVVTIKRFSETSQKMWELDIFICVECYTHVYHQPPVPVLMLWGLYAHREKLNDINEQLWFPQMLLLKLRLISLDITLSQWDVSGTPFCLFLHLGGNSTKWVSKWDGNVTMEKKNSTLTLCDVNKNVIVRQSSCHNILWSD